ncbi:MAG: hypothetical protein GXP27_15885 [Planctomycetes bacterium]|nr:hypothetical protein [Planctomycetota bacterium]
MTNINDSLSSAKWLIPFALVLLGTAVTVALMWGEAARSRAEFERLLADPEALRELEEEVRQSPRDVERAFRLATVYRIRILMGISIPGSTEALNQIVSAMPEAGIELSDETKRDLKRVNTKSEELTAKYAVDVESEAKKGERLMQTVLRQPGVPAEDQAWSHIMLGHFQLAQRKLADALESSRQAEQLDPISPFPHLLRAEVLDKQGDYEEAIAENQTAVGKAAAWAGVQPTFAQQMAWAFTSPNSAVARSKERNWRKQKQQIAEWISTSAGMHILQLRLSIKQQRSAQQHEPTD